MADDSKISELRLKTDDQLADMLGECKRETFNLRFQAATGQLENPSRMRDVRRTIARIKTLQVERTAGASSAPNPPSSTQSTANATKATKTSKASTAKDSAKGSKTTKAKAA